MDIAVPDIIFLDNHLLVVYKPAGMLVQKDRTGDPSLLDLAKAYVKGHFSKPGNVYLGLVHRLDRPVSGVIVFARTSKAAARLSEQFREGRVEKIYQAVVEGEIAESGELEDRIIRSGSSSYVGKGGEGKLAHLSFQRLKSSKGRSLLEITLGTGRHHQIRVQLSNLGYPIVGDFRYGSKAKYKEGAIALHARSLSITHPTRKERMTFTAEPDNFFENLF